MAGNSGGPWGGGGSSGGGGSRGGNGGDRGQNGSGNGGGGGRRPEDGPQIPEIEELMKKGQDQLRVLMGGRGGSGNRGGGSGDGSGGGGPVVTRGMVIIGVLAALALWIFASVYVVNDRQQSVEMFLGRYSGIGDPGLNFAPWPFVTKEIVSVTQERTEEIGKGRGDDSGLMLTGDANVVDIDFQVVWNVKNPAEYIFNLRDPQMTIRAVSESAMREIIAQSELAPILNRDRGIIASRLEELVQQTLDSYNSGVNIVRVNFDRADPPETVIDAFRDVQAAAQERDRLQNVADAYANRVLAEARGEAAQILEQAEAYRAQQINQAEGEASRFVSVLEEYRKAPEVTRKRLYLETMEKVMSDVDKVILDNQVGGQGQGQGVVPYLPLNELRRNGGSN